VVVGSPMVALHVSTCDRNGLLAIEVQPEKVMDEVSACRPTSQSNTVITGLAFIAGVLQCC